MKEEFLHFLWKTKRFECTNLITTEGDPIQILNFGQYNQNSGPDFLNARVKISGTIWAGSVEIHIFSSDWIKHFHSSDDAYNNVILHVVLEEDKPIFQKNNCRIPCLELRKRIPSKVYKKYLQLKGKKTWIPCSKSIHRVPEINRKLWMSRVMVERLEQKIIHLESLLKEYNGDWESAFFSFLGRYFGGKVNTDTFEILTKSIPFKTILKERNRLLSIEAIFFGQSGLLDDAENATYVNKLKKEYAFLKQKHQLQSINKVMWQFSKLRPQNFPTIRIAQFARLYFQTTNLFSKSLVASSLEELENMLNVEVSDYWYTHYSFSRNSPKIRKRLGKNTIHMLIINAVSNSITFTSESLIIFRFTFKDRHK